MTMVAANQKDVRFLTVTSVNSPQTLQNFESCALNNSGTVAATIENNYQDGAESMELAAGEALSIGDPDIRVIKYLKITAPAGATVKVVYFT